MEYKVCETPGNILVYLCNHAFLYLRKTHLEYKNTLYVNYKVFQVVNKNACKTVIVKIPPQDGGIEQLVFQHVLTCYARGPIDESLDMNPRDYQFYDKIVIYPYQYKNLIIFEQSENRNEFKILDWMKNIYWRSINNVHHNIFLIPVPVRKDLPVNMNKMYVQFSYFI